MTDDARQRRLAAPHAAEGVIFALVRDGHVLVEHRPSHDVYAGMDVLPGGTLDPEDFAQPDPPEAALLREVQEELNAVLLDYEWLSSFPCFDPFRTPTRLVLIHFYVVFRWEGEIPSHSQEGGEDFGRLHWLPVERGGELPHPCHRRMMRELVRRLGRAR